MKIINSKNMLMAGFSIVLAMLACNVPALTGRQSPDAASPIPPAASTDASQATLGAANPLPTFAAATPTSVLTHNIIPAKNVKTLKLVYDVESIDTAAEKRAPYGDSYKINRFERPFMQDMTYNSNIDIASYSFGEDNNFFYISIELVGTDPNDPIGINYGVELDLDSDGFGDTIIWVHPQYNIEWSTDSVQVFADKNHDTGGLSAERSDAPLPGDGYETLIFNGGRGQGDDPDLAWVRVNAGRLSTVQIAFKKSLGDDRFMYGVIADAGLKDVGKLDYVDRFTEFEAGSPEKSEKFYPLKAVFGVDNVCRETYGFQGTGEEPQRCPFDQPKPDKPQRTCTQPSWCFVWDQENCACLQGSVTCLAGNTQIDTPNGPRAVESLQVGDSVWTADATGARVQAAILKTSRILAPVGHQMAHIILSDARELWASPKHPTADGRTLGDLAVGDLLDGARVTQFELVPYNQPATFDILPSGSTGYYWANGILTGSTLSNP